MTFLVQTCVEEVENAEYAAPLKPLLSMRGEEPLDQELDARSRLREYVDSKRRLVAKKLCYARPTRSSWPLKQGSMGDIFQLKEDLEQKITTWQQEVDPKLMKSLWGAHVRTPEEDELSEECVCEPPRVCQCCHRPPETVERDLLYTYQRLKDATKDAEPVEDHLPAYIHQGASNLHSDEDMEDKIKLLDPRVKKLIRTYLEVFGELPPPASCDKLVQMDLEVEPELVGHKIRRRPYPAPKEQADDIERQIQECIDAGLVVEYKDGDYPRHCSPCFLVAKPGSIAKRLVVDYGELNKKTLNHSGQGWKRRRIYTRNVYIRVLHRENTIQYASAGGATDWRQTRVPPQRMRLKTNKTRDFHVSAGCRHFACTKILTVDPRHIALK